jgi:2-iminobutanoate/2-iminopropanoate deaminase
MPRYIRVPEAAPSPKTARYSHAVEAGGLLFVTGQLAVDPDNFDAPLPPGVGAQTEFVFRNLVLIVEAAGYKLSDTVFARIFLTHFERDYPEMNAVYNRYFSDDARMPSRTTVGVTKLARDGLVEIDLVVAKG